MSDVLCVLKGLIAGDIYVHADGGVLRLTQASGGEVKLSAGHAYALMAVSREYFKFDSVLRPESEPEPEPAEGTVALLCAAARKWAKWDARWQEIMQHDTCDSVVYDRIKMKCEKWRTRTLSYGHHLLSAPVPKDDVWTPEQLAQLEALNKQPLEFNRICIDPAAEMKRLDTLVQQLCARVAVLEDGGRTSQL